MFSANTSQVSGNVSLFLAHADNSYADSSSFANPVLNNNNISFGSAYFGSAAFYQPATDPAAYINWTANFSIAAGEDFGMEAWWSPSGSNIQISIFGIGGPSASLYIGRDNARGPYLGWQNGYLTSGYGVPFINSYHHLAFEVFNGVATSYVNGTPYQSANWSGSFPSGTSSVFALSHWGAQYDDGVSVLDEIRLYRGAIRRGASFTPPTAPYIS